MTVVAEFLILKHSPLWYRVRSRMRNSSSFTWGIVLINHITSTHFFFSLYEMRFLRHALCKTSIPTHTHLFFFLPLPFLHKYIIGTIFSRKVLVIEVITVTMLRKFSTFQGMPPKIEGKQTNFFANHFDGALCRTYCYSFVEDCRVN